MRNLVQAIILGIGFLAVWSGCFFVAIRRDLRQRNAGKVDGKAISRLYITDLWAVTLALSPAIWLLSFGIRSFQNHWSDWPIFGVVIIVVASELLGMFGAMIRLASRYGKYPPTRMDRALWLLTGAFNGLVIMWGSIIVAGCILGPIAAVTRHLF